MASGTLPSKTALLLTRAAQLILAAVLLNHAIPFLRSVFYLWGAPELIWYEFRHTGIGALTVLFMLVFVQFSKTVIATMATMFSIAGLHDFVLYEWSAYMFDDLYWAVPFACSAICLVVAIYLETKKPGKLS